MKKMYLILLCMAAFALTACKGSGSSVSDIDKGSLDNTTEKCWEITATVGGQSETTYVWATEFLAVAIMQNAQEQTGNKVTYTYKENSAKDENSCISQNPDYEESSCWRVNLNLGLGATQTFYMWDTEESVLSYLKTVYEPQGINYICFKADAADEDACEKLNENTPDPDQPDPSRYDEYDNTTLKCWEISITTYGTTIVEYVWSTERAVVMNLDEGAKIGNVTCSYKEADADDEDACAELAQNANGKSCWKLTVSAMGQEIVTQYVWVSESEIELIENAMKEEMAKQFAGIEISISATPADAGDPDACEALNQH